jgi:hypothetical protein
MNLKTCFVAALVSVVFVPASLLAQEYGPDDSSSVDAVREVDDEDVDDEEVDDEEAVRWDFRVTNEIHSSDNIDLQPLDESTNQRTLDTDQRHTFGFTSFAAGVSYDVLEDTTFNVGGTMSGLWGSDQLGTTTAFGGFAYIYDLSVDWTAVDSQAFELSTTMGRHGFSIGGARDDFFFKDIVDGATLMADFGRAGRLRLMGDVFGDTGRPDHINFVRFVSGDKQTTNNFRGDVNVYRFGGVYELLDAVEGVDLRAFAFGSHIGATRAVAADNETSTGADRSHQGAIGNVADGDYTWMVGSRLNYTLELDTLELGVMGEFARSGGIDRKSRHLGFYDVTSNGNAYGAAAHVSQASPTVGVDGRLRFFYADGASYTEEEGLPFNYGFVSMKGSQIGGVAMSRYAGWHPSAYVSGFKGHDHAPQDIERKAGIMSVRAGVGFEFAEKVRLDLDAWHFQDASESNFDIERAEEVGAQTEWGYSEAELLAQERLGKTLGNEIDAAVTYFANEALSLYAIGGIFLAGEFYETPITRNAGTSLGAPEGEASQLEDFWLVAGGMTLAF